MLQEVLAATTVLLAAGYLAFKLFWQPAARAKRPDVPASRLVRRARPPAEPPAHGGCH